MLCNRSTTVGPGPTTTKTPQPGPDCAVPTCVVIPPARALGAFIEKGRAILVALTTHRKKPQQSRQPEKQRRSASQQLLRTETC